MHPLKVFLWELLLRASPSLFLRLGAHPNTLCGRAGERLAARHLRHGGHKILAKKLRHPAAELDLVTATRTHLVVVEVKTGRAGREPLSARFTTRAKARQRLAAADLARRYGLQPRLDLIEIHLKAAGEPPTLRHTHAR